MTWIKVKEHAPPERVWVWVCGPNHIVSQAYKLNTGEKAWHWHVAGSTMSAGQSRFTHWMHTPPLPNFEE